MRHKLGELHSRHTSRIVIRGGVFVNRTHSVTVPNIVHIVIVIHLHFRRGVSVVRLCMQAVQGTGNHVSGNAEKQRENEYYGEETLQKRIHCCDE
ncbi:MAG: hypothetical protein GVY08_08600 [Bacteroidetes bacterium]|nr:hypothetical protein [Bacteroidota bacterium]